MVIQSPILLTIALVLMIGTIVVAWVRRVRLPPTVAGCLIIGMALIALAAGGLSVRWPDPRRALVMIDLSPSTRTASYRDPAVREARIKQLLGDVQYSVRTFDDGEQVEQTRFDPPPADAIVLFSDAQFDPPAGAPPTYVVVDPNLDRPADASVADLEIRAGELITTIHNSGGPRELSFTGATGPTTAAAGQPLLTARIDPAATLVTARLGAGDPWPENDSLSIRPPQRLRDETWWVSETDGPANHRTFRPGELPTDPAAYLMPSVIVLNNIPATDLSPIHQQRLLQYVRALGGGLVILGGEQAFAAGGYLGTELDALSPLASAPPGPQRYWIVLADSSGSMAGEVDGQTRWQRAAAAATQVLGALPPNDPVSVGSFARDVRWWSQGRSARESGTIPIPQDITPSGPTNIQVVLALLARQLRANVVTEIILISDADAQIDDPAALGAALRGARASVNLLLTGQEPRTPVLQIVAFTAGRMIPQTDPGLWAQDAVKLARSTMRDYLEQRPTRVSFAGTIAQLAERQVEVWNRTWIKADATELAATRENNAPIAMGAAWRVGAGKVAAVAFPANQSEAAALAELVQQPPRDPKFTVSHTTGPELSVRVDAVDGETYLNDLNVNVALHEEGRTYRPPTVGTLNQTAPGRYELSLPAPRTPVVAVVRAGEQIIDRFAVAGRQAPEFETIGNDHKAMTGLAAQSGGAVIEPSQSTPIDFRWTPRTIPLLSILSLAAAAFIALGLILWKTL